MTSVASQLRRFHGGAPLRLDARSAAARPSWSVLVLALVCYVPLLCTAPGRVVADTKAYLHIDPSRLLSRAPFMWDPHVGMGTVTHQNIGYLLPMGPWYWLFAHVGVPTWVAQRLWTGTLLFAAGSGVLFLLRTLDWRRRTAALAALAYALSPYVLEYEARTSAILMPWAGLPWMVGIAVRALRSPRSWRYPAAFALVVAVIGGVNATSLIYAALGPVLWVPFAIWSRREVTVREAAGVAGRTALLTGACSLWWIAGLSMQSGYGLDVVAYTETVKTVATTSHPAEVLRGLGNWFFYGRDRVSPWVETSTGYLTSLPLLAVSFLVPLVALLSAAALRWRERAYFVTLTMVGLLIAVGTYPYDDPSPFGRVFKAFAEGSRAGLALRSTPRATPLVVLGLAVLLAAGIDALCRMRPVLPPRSRRRWLAPAATVLVTGLIAADFAPLWTLSFADESLQGPSKVPSYWSQAGRALDAQGPASRVLELPGADFSYYRWGTTADPVTPGLMDRPTVGRELTPYGTPASAALIRAIDRRLQEGVFEPSALPELARLMGVGDVLLRSDLQYERFRTPRPRATWQEWARPVSGLGRPTAYGPPVAERPVVPLIDEITLGTPAGAPDPPAVATFPIEDRVPIVRAERADRPVVLDGDAEGLVDAAAAGLLNGTGSILFAASQEAGTLGDLLSGNADLIVSDSNRRRAERWGTIRDNYGYTERAGEEVIRDPADSRLPVFPGAGDDTRTVTEQRGVASVTASDYGNPVSYVPADRPAMAFDGDLTSAWRVGAFSDVRGARLRIDLGAAVRTDHITLVQPLTGQRNRWLTRVGVRLDGGPEQSGELGPQSRTAAGQVVRFPTRNVRVVEIVLHDTSAGLKAEYTGDSGVGFAEVKVGDRRLDEVVRLPTDVLSAAGAASLDHRLTLLFSRERANPAEPVAEDGELSLARGFTLPSARSFSVSGTARLSAAATDPTLDRMVGRSGPLVFGSSVRLGGALSTRAGSAFDQNPSTAWSTIFGQPTGQWVQVDAPRQVTVDRLQLRPVTDGRHSVPTTVRLITDDRVVRDLTLPSLRDLPGENASQPVELRFPPVTGRSLRLQITGIRAERTVDYYSRTPYDLPVALAEVGIAGLTAPAEPTELPAPCRDDLISVDGRPMPVRVTGATADAESRQGLALTGCGPVPRLSAGAHVLRTAQGRFSGLDVDRLVLASGRGGGAAPLAPSGSIVPPGPERTNGAPIVRVMSQDATSFRLRVDGATAPFRLVLGQSVSAGWHARVVNGPSLGTPQLVDGYANGWMVVPSPGRSSFQVALTWDPQRTVFVALAVSGAALVGCLVIVIMGLRSGGSEHLGCSAAGPSIPHLELLRAATGARPRWTAVVGLTLFGLGSAAVVSPVAGVVAAALTSAGLILPRGRALLRLTAVLCFAAAAAYAVYLEGRYHLPADFQLPQAFRSTTSVAWLSVVLVVADVLAGWARTRAGRDRQHNSHAPPERRAGPGNPIPQ